DLVELVLSGQLLDGAEFAVTDCIRLVPPGTPPGLLSVSSNVPGVFVDLAPLDLQLDGGGFDSFDRTFPVGTEVTLTAPARHEGQAFTGWRLGPVWGQAGDDPPLVSGQTMSLTVLGNQLTVETVYRAAADINGDGTVGTADFLLLLAAWGPCPAPPADCFADIDGDGNVGATDFLALLVNWGPCP
ncbi:MAG: dockerin type I domain-containing protein, partial [Acidimicrobiia bacterium]